MKLEIETKCKLYIPGLLDTVVTMEPAELLKFHDELTKFINDNWEALKEKD